MFCVSQNTDCRKNCSFSTVLKDLLDIREGLFCVRTLCKIFKDAVHDALREAEGIGLEPLRILRVGQIGELDQNGRHFRATQDIQPRPHAHAVVPRAGALHDAVQHMLREPDFRSRCSEC